MGFVNGGYEILLYKYLWVATSPCGGFGEKFRNMKCSRSDSMTILGLLRVTLCSESNIFNEPKLIFPTFNDQIHIVLQYIDIFQRMLHINKKQSDGIFFWRNQPSN